MIYSWHCYFWRGVWWLVVSTFYVHYFFFVVLASFLRIWKLSYRYKYRYRVLATFEPIVLKFFIIENENGLIHKYSYIQKKWNYKVTVYKFNYCNKCKKKAEIINFTFYEYQFVFSTIFSVQHCFTSGKLDFPSLEKVSLVQK
jgi:hypothetical protein